MPQLEALPPLDALDLMREVDDALPPLLRGLEPEDWDRRAVGIWSVRDVAAHLLDTALRRLSLDRDRHRPPIPRGKDLAQWRDLVDFLNDLNAVWVQSTARLSPRVLIDLLEWVDPRVHEYLASLDPEGEAAFPVAWAGEASSRVWMDVAREFTERWHHQQQIREAVGAPWIDQPKYVRPLLDTLIRALVRAYEATEAPQGTSVRVATIGLEGAVWRLACGEEGWGVYVEPPDLEPEATIELPAETAWRLFIKGISGDQARGHATTSGPGELTDPFFSTLAVMA